MNKSVIAIFKNRSYTYAFYNTLQKNKIKCAIIDTPKQNFVSCGISVKFQYKDFSKANNLIQLYKDNFVRFMII